MHNYRIQRSRPRRLSFHATIRALSGKSAPLALAGGRREQLIGAEATSPQKECSFLFAFLRRWIYNNAPFRISLCGYTARKAVTCERRDIHEQRRTAATTGAAGSSTIRWPVISPGTVVSSSRTFSEIFTTASADVSGAEATRREHLPLLYYQ
jgi:hypothetical protein